MTDEEAAHWITKGWEYLAGLEKQIAELPLDEWMVFLGQWDSAELMEDGKIYTAEKYEVIKKMVEVAVPVKQFIESMKGRQF